MTTKRKIEIFTAGCPACEETIATIKAIACQSCEVVTLDTHEPSIAQRAKALGVQSVPAVVVDGQLASCCVGRGVDEAALRAAGLGQPLA